METNIIAFKAAGASVTNVVHYNNNLNAHINIDCQCVDSLNICRSLGFDDETHKEFLVFQ